MSDRRITLDQHNESDGHNTVHKIILFGGGSNFLFVFYIQYVRMYRFVS